MGLVLSCLIGLLVDSPAWAGQADPPGGASAERQTLTESQWKRGYHGLSVLARSMDLQLLDNLDEFEQVPANESFLVLLGLPSPELASILPAYLNRGGAVLIATDQDSGDRLLNLGLRFFGGPVKLTSRSDQFQGLNDCPTIFRLKQSHSTLRNVTWLVGNRTGALGVRVRSELRNEINRQEIAWLPQGSSIAGRLLVLSPPFIASSENQAGGRLLTVADESIFSNQMLIHGDNALFLQQSLQWLAENPQTGQRRSTVCILTGDQALPPLNPADVELLVPPPDPRDVLDALRQLPPDMLVEFANRVATIAEDEGIINELLLEGINGASEKRLAIWLTVVPALIIAIFLLWRLLFGSNTNDREKNSTGYNGEAFESDSADAAYERFLAAHELMRSFIAEHARQRRESGEETNSSSGVGLPPPLYRQFRKLNRQLRRFQRDYWTEKRLIAVEQQIATWEATVRVPAVTSNRS